MELRTLGRFQLIRNGIPVDLGSGKLCGLLAYLASPGQTPQPRDRLMTLFWGSHFDAQARQNLRKSLSRLRKVLGEDVLGNDESYVSVSSRSLWVDARQFEELVAVGSLDALRSALDLYRGDFLTGLAIDQSAWAEWLAARREGLARTFVEALLRLARHEAETGAVEPALELGRRVIAADPYREEGYRIVMSALGGLGRRAEALRAFDDLAALLKRDLDVRPEAATVALAASLRQSIDPASALADRRPEAGPSPTEAAPPLPDRPSIAVLPFERGGGDPFEDYFTDGLTEDLIAALSRLRWLFVISRSSTFTFKGQTVDVRRVGRELGVRYVLEGRVRVQAGRVRISTQLIDAQTGVNVLTHRFERDFSELFALQDEVTEYIAAALEPGIRSVEIERVRRKPAASLDAYDLYLRALHEVYKLNEEDYARATILLRQAVALDPDYADALSVLAECRGRQWANGWVPMEQIAAVKAEGVALAQRAAAADPGNGLVLAVLAYAFAIFQGRFEEALPLVERAPALQPSSDYVFALCGQVLVHALECDKAITFFDKARRLNPIDPRAYVSLNGIAMAHFHADRYEEAAYWARLAIAERSTWNVARRYRAAALAHLGRLDEARSEIADLLAVQPDSSLTRSRTSSFRYPAMYDQYIGGLRLAGLPER